MNMMMAQLRGKLRHNIPLARYTSWWVGGDAQTFYEPADLADLIVFMQTLPPNEPLLWLGLGSNVLIRDGGFPGTVILTQGHLKEVTQLDEFTVRAEAGLTCAKMAKYCARQAYANSAFFAGIPGTIGGALAMNAGAFGGETWEAVVAVESIDRTGKIHLRSPEEYKIAYRTAIGPAAEWFVAGHFQFKHGNALQAEAAIRELLKKRTASQPIGQLSCGSVFRNPPGDYAGRLIEASGLKSYRIGGAWVSEKHANFIINGKEATATDIESLIEYVANKVYELHKVHLEPEVRILGVK